MFLKNMKCDYCFQIYYDAAADAAMDGKDWIECTSCQKWNHTDCEIVNGKDKKMKQVAVDIKNQENQRCSEEIACEDASEEAAYWCLKCRKANSAA